MIFYFWITSLVLYCEGASISDLVIVNLEIKPDVGQINVSRKSLLNFNQTVESPQLLNLKGNLLKDLAELEEIVSKFTNVILVQAYIAPNSILFIDCYTQTFLKEFSEKLKTTIFITSRLATCFESKISRNGNFPNDRGIVLTSVSTEYYGKMLSDLVSTENWNNVAIIYDHYEVFCNFYKAIQHSDSNFHFRLWTNTMNNTEMLQKLRQINIFILDLNGNALKLFFQSASRLQIFNEITTKIIIIERNSEFELVKKFTPSVSNITIIRPVTYKAYPVNNTVNGNLMIQDDSKSQFDRKLRSLFLKTLQKFLNEAQLNEIDLNKNFIPAVKWIKKFISYITNEMPRIMDVNQNYYFDTSFEAVFLPENYFKKSSLWSYNEGFSSISFTDKTTSKNNVTKFDDKILRVSTIYSEPFVIYRETDDNGSPLEGNSRFSGMSIDILKHLSKMYNFKYVLHLVKDSKYGMFNDKTGTWSGMVGEIINNEADMAIGPITITYERNRVIDFTIPFMNIGINAIIKKESSSNNSFMSPFSISLWLMILGSYIIVSLTLFLVGRLSPYEWCPKVALDPNKATNSFSVFNCFYYALGLVRRENNDVTLRSFSTRMISTIWWIFIILFIISYAAMLVVLFLTENDLNNILSIEDLSRQTKIKYGTIKSGSTYSIFQKSNIEAYKKMGNFMRQNPSVLVNNIDEGIKRVLNGDYALILESTMNEFYNKRNCELSPLMGRHFTRGYGIGLRSGNTILQQKLSEGILRLAEAQILESLRYQWFEVYGVTEACESKILGGFGQRNRLTLKNMKYFFITLIILLIASCFVACCELMIWAYKQSKRNKTTFSNAICGQLRLAFCCHIRLTPVPSGDPLLEKSLTEDKTTDIA